MNDRASQWQRINAILEGVLEQPAERREDLVREACGGDAALVQEVLQLLALDDDETLIRTPIRSEMDALLRDMSDRSSLIGTRIGPFVLIREIARGGMGQVFEAQRDGDDFEQTVAIKILPGYRLDTEARARFAAERRILAGLQHPNIAQLIDGGTLDDGMPYIVMEYVDGLRIDRYCRGEQLSNRAILELVLQVCDAVQLAHRKLIVHRDIKPANILVDRNGTPKLLDFGIAKLLDVEEDAGAEQTRTGMRLLTPAYASPEQIQGGDITTAVDVYALGLLSYVLLTHRLPYAADPTDSRTLEQQILSAPPEAPSDALVSRNSLTTEGEAPDWPKQQRRALKGEIDTILLTALRKEPDRRYANVAAFAEDLRRHLEHRPIQARSDTLAYRLGLLLKRHPVAVPVSSLAISLAIGAGSVFTWMLAEERDQARVAELRAVETAQFAASLLSSSNAQNDGDRLVPVTELLNTASERIVEELAGQPLVALPLHLALGEAFFSWGQYAEGIEQAESARALAAEAGLAQDQAIALDLLARIQHELGDSDEALRLTRQAFEFVRQAGSSSERTRMLMNMALSLNEAGHRLEALPVFAEAETAMREEHGDRHPDLAWLNNNYGWCLHALGRYDEAMQRYEASLDVLDQLDIPFDRALTLSNRAALLRDLGQPRAAVRDWEEALALLQGMFGDEGHASVARGHHLLSLGLSEIGQLEAALEHSDQAVAMNTRVLGPEHRWLAYTLNSRAEVQLKLGDLEAAETDIETAAAILEAQRGPEHLDYADVHMLRGRLALKRGRIDDAIVELRRSRRLAKPLADVERTSIDRIEWSLALALAASDPDAGRAQAREVIERLGERFEDSDWRLRIKRAVIALPPFNQEPTPEQTRSGAALVEELSERIGSDAPRVHELREALAAVASR